MIRISIAAGAGATYAVVVAVVVVVCAVSGVHVRGVGVRLNRRYTRVTSAGPAAPRPQGSLFQKRLVHLLRLQIKRNQTT